jgi:hypothetical protein
VHGPETPHPGRREVVVGAVAALRRGRSVQSLGIDGLISTRVRGELAVWFLDNLAIAGRRRSDHPLSQLVLRFWF